MECHAFRGMLGFLALALGCSEAPPSKPGSSQGIPVSSAGSGAGLSAGGSSAGGQSGGLGESPAVGEGGATSNIVTGPNGETLLLLADAEGGPDAGGTFADPTYGFTGYWYMYNDETLGATQVLTYDPADRTSYAAHTNGSGFTTWGAGIGLNFDLPIDATQFSGIGFWIKLGGSPHQVRFSAVNGQVELPADGGTCDETLGICSDKFGSSLKTLDGSWKFVKFKWSELRQEGWGQRFEAMDPSS
ncbi:MAG TPA: hypothetical protein VGP93_08805, partial [Polyangiaceae bacterium]|nr:hypothetical protein [Polyangiaceae bacterium]